MDIAGAQEVPGQDLLVKGDGAATTDPVANQERGGLGTPAELVGRSPLGAAAKASTKRVRAAADGDTKVPMNRAFLEMIRPWVPGTRVVYRKQRGGPTRAAEQGFPIWAVASQPPQEAMFNAADQICPQAFYVAADQWSDSRIVKEFGAFGTAEDFLTTLNRSVVRCYYEVIRADRPCKAPGRTRLFKPERRGGAT